MRSTKGPFKISRENIQVMSGGGGGRERVEPVEEQKPYRQLN